MNALPFLYIPPDVAQAPVLVVVPHAGTRVGRAESARIPLPEAARLKDADLLAERLVDTSASLGAHLMVATVSRWVCDVDRDPSELDSRTCPELAKGRGDFPRGVIWRETSDGVPCLEGTLSRAEVEERLARIHTGFHRKLDEVLTGLVAAHGHATVLDLRTVPSVGRSASPDAGRERPSVVLPDAGVASSDLLAEVARHFEAQKIPVVRQVAAQPSYLASRHAGAASKVAWVQLQLSRRLYLHEDVPFWAGAPALELQRLTRSLVARLCELAR
jgi:N-formylglutamate deformylase